jgi:hypothetical protein
MTLYELWANVLKESAQETQGNGRCARNRKNTALEAPELSAKVARVSNETTSAKASMVQMTEAAVVDEIMPEPYRAPVARMI